MAGLDVTDTDGVGVLPVCPRGCGLNQSQDQAQCLSIGLARSHILFYTELNLRFTHLLAYLHVRVPTP